MFDIVLKRKRSNKAGGVTSPSPVKSSSASKKSGTSKKMKKPRVLNDDDDHFDPDMQISSGEYIGTAVL